MPDSLSPYAEKPLVRGVDYDPPTDEELGRARQNKPPFRFIPEHDGTLSLESAVFQALGYASTCWENMEGTGVFASDRAKECGEALVDFVRRFDPAAEKIPPGVKYSDTHGPTVQVGDGMITHPDPDMTVWLAVDGNGVGNTVAEWLETRARLHELEETCTRMASSTAATHQPDWSLRLEVLRILAGAGTPAEAWPALAPPVLAFVTEGDSPRGPAPDWAGSLEAAWGIIANAGGGDWANETPEWQEAATRWRDAYHAALATEADR